jgi:hypothetical protein
MKTANVPLVLGTDYQQMARHQRLTATKGSSLLSKLEGSGKDVLQLWTDSLFASAFGPSP